MSPPASEHDGAGGGPGGLPTWDLSELIDLEAAGVGVDAEGDEEEEHSHGRVDGGQPREAEPDDQEVETDRRPLRRSATAELAAGPRSPPDLLSQCCQVAHRS